jgi:hypothetical protein
MHKLKSGRLLYRSARIWQALLASVIGQRCKTAGMDSTGVPLAKTLKMP